MTTELALSRQSMSLPETESLAKHIVQSGYFKDSRSASQAVVKILAGREIGLPPIASMREVYIVKDKVSFSAHLIAGLVKGSQKYDYRVTRLDDKGCSVTFLEGGKEIGKSEFGEEDARRAQLVAGDNYKKYPRNMYFSRAIANGCRWYCPDVFNGSVYTPDELGAVVDGETLEPVKVEVVAVKESTDAGVPNQAVPDESLLRREISNGLMSIAGEKSAAIAMLNDMFGVNSTAMLTGESLRVAHEQVMGMIARQSEIDKGLHDQVADVEVVNA